MSLWRKAQEAKDICEQEESRNERIERACAVIAERMEKALKDFDRSVTIPMCDLPLYEKEIPTIITMLRDDGYQAKYHESEEILDNYGLSWGRKPANITISWYSDKKRK